MADRITKLAIKDIAPNPHNLRSELTDIAELAASIRFMGLLQPIRVDKDGKIIAGHRRREALDYLVQHYDDWTEDTIVPCIVGNKISESDETAAMLVENMQRVDLDITEQVEGVRRLMVDYGWTQAEVASNLGVSKEWVKDRVNIQNVPTEVFAAERVLPVKTLSQLGELPDKVVERLVAKESGISQYDVEDRYSKMKSEERTERLLKKFRKDGYLATTEQEIKRLMKSDGTGLDGLDSMVKTKIGPAESIETYEWNAKGPAIVLKQVFGNVEEQAKEGKLDKNELLVASKSGGFWRWYTVEHVTGKPKPTEEDRQAERERMLAEREVEDQARITGIHNRIEGAKPAELIVDVLWDVIRSSLMGLASGYSTTVQVMKAIGLEPLEIAPELEDQGDWSAVNEAKKACAEENHDAIVTFAKKNNGTLARTAAACRMVGARSDEHLVENWGVEGIKVREDAF